MPEAPLDERELIALATAGDGMAMRQLYEAHVDRVFGLAYRLAGNRDLAEDFVQEAFLRAFDRLAGFRGEAAFSSWLHAVTVSVAINGLRKLGRRRKHEVQCADGEAPDLPVMDDLELKRRLATAIDELPEDLRAMVLLHYAEGYKHRELAELLGIPEGTSKARLARALALLRASLGIKPGPRSRGTAESVLTMETDKVDSMS